jgi:hypothetical protein
VDRDKLQLGVQQCGDKCDLALKGKAGEGGEIAQQVLQFEQEVERDIYSITLSLA